VFQIFALRGGELFSEVPGRQEIFEAVTARALAGGYLIGTYSREQKVKSSSAEEEDAGVRETPELFSAGTA
jgi:hypothetical protein